ncbi:hypothetical protein BJX68DRAFT_266339 [Aspergillus pseudodeflectus]|uniref:DUF7580 domain-containing protein n=1 Tax=Aspergillus pseudodeflectus TaxID=176178 RepID=A0ABR4KHA8_9EURO
MDKRRMEKCLKDIKEWIAYIKDVMRGEDEQASIQRQPLPTCSTIELAFPVDKIQKDAARVYQCLLTRRCAEKPHLAYLLLEQRILRSKPTRQENNRGLPVLYAAVKPRHFHLRLAGECYEGDGPFEAEFTLLPTEIPSPQEGGGAAMSVFYGPPRQTQEITDLCEYAKCPGPRGVGLYLHRAQALQGHPLVDQPVPDPPEEYESLWSLLSGIESDATKLCLALTLASSVLQLSRTPWFTHGWTGDDIVFAGSQGKTVIGAQPPYLAKCFPPNQRDEGGNVASHSSRLCYLSLAIVLVEIWTGEPYEGSRPADDASTLIDLFDIVEFINPQRPFTGPGFQGAVDACIREVTVGSMGSAVLQPLEDEIQDILRRKPNEHR